MLLILIFLQRVSVKAGSTGTTGPNQGEFIISPQRSTQKIKVISHTLR